MVLWRMGKSRLILYALWGVMVFGLFQKLEAQDGKFIFFFFVSLRPSLRCKCHAMGKHIHFTVLFSLDWEESLKVGILLFAKLYCLITSTCTTASNNRSK